MAKETGGPAFPRPAVFTEALGLASVELDGMTMRDYFAAKALQGLIAATPNGDIPHSRAATDAYKYADAMLEARDDYTS